MSSVWRQILQLSWQMGHWSCWVISNMKYLLHVLYKWNHLNSHNLYKARTSYNYLLALHVTCGSCGLMCVTQFTRIKGAKGSFLTICKISNYKIWHYTYSIDLLSWKANFTPQARVTLVVVIFTTCLLKPTSWCTCNFCPGRGCFFIVPFS